MTNKPLPPEMVKAFASITIQNCVMLGRFANAHHNLIEALGDVLPGSVSMRLRSDIEQVQAAVAKQESLANAVQAMLEKL
jgi:hypothetical protein